MKTKQKKARVCLSNETLLFLYLRAFRERLIRSMFDSFPTTIEAAWTLNATRSLSQQCSLERHQKKRKRQQEERNMIIPFSPRAFMATTRNEEDDSQLSSCDFRFSLSWFRKSNFHLNFTQFFRMSSTITSNWKPFSISPCALRLFTFFSPSSHERAPQRSIRNRSDSGKTICSFEHSDLMLGWWKISL